MAVHDGAKLPQDNDGALYMQQQCRSHGTMGNDTTSCPQHAASTLYNMYCDAGPPLAFHRPKYLWRIA